MPVDPVNPADAQQPPSRSQFIRIYAAADIHSRPSRLTRMDRIIRTEKPHVLVLAGDLINYRRPSRVAAWIRSLALPVLVIRGNTDPRRHWEAFRQIPHVRDLHLTTVALHGCRFAGVGGTFILPLRSKLAFREVPAISRLVHLLHPGGILVTHPPPFGCRDKVLGRFRSGSRGLAAFIEWAQPAVAICGHIHEQAGCERINDTVVVNCTMGRGGSGAIIEMAGGHHPKIRMV